MKDILFHIHTKYSYDSFMEPRKIVEKVRDLGHKGVAIVDHGNIKGGLEAKKFETKEFKVIVGGEYHSEIGDIIGLGLRSNIKSHHSCEIISQIKAQGGIAIFAHPRRTFLIPRGRGKRKPIPSRDILEQFDYIETFNAQTRPSENIEAKEIAKKYGLKEISGLDAHFYFELKPIAGYSFTGYLGTFFAKALKRNSI